MTIVANLANRKRRTRLTVPDWLALAAALDVPPMLLLTPSMPAGEIEAMPEWSVPSMRAYYWITGQGYGGGYGGSASALDYVKAANDWTEALLWEQITREDREKAEEEHADANALRAHDLRIMRAYEAVKDAERLGRAAAAAAGFTWDAPARDRDFLDRFFEDRPADG